jgi:16S rRNA (guanine1207-N2)-methyltransferase
VAPALAAGERIRHDELLMPHYFENPAEGPDDPRIVVLNVNQRDLRLRTGTGVFSRVRLDPGTSVLLDAVPPPAGEGDLLDLGCGYGPIALTMAVLSPRATVWAVDVNERARELCEQNAAAAGLGNVRVCGPEDVPAGVRFATIWSDPPIRVGKEPLHAMLQHWLGRLAGGGEAFLVVQRHLGSDSLQRWLEEQGWPTSRLGSRKGFRILRCVH